MLYCSVQSSICLIVPSVYNLIEWQVSILWLKYWYNTKVWVLCIYIDYIVSVLIAVSHVDVSIDDYTLAVPVYYCDIISLLFPLCTPPFFVSRECAVCGLNINLTKDLFITSSLVLIYISIFLTNGRQIIKLDVGWSQAVQMTCVLPPYCFNIVSL